MRKILMLIVFAIIAVSFLGFVVEDTRLFAQYPPPPPGCCMQRDWLAGAWYKTYLSFTSCEELNRNRDNLDDMFVENGYVWWDVNCVP
jgi:hypothetical protein